VPSDYGHNVLDPPGMKFWRQDRDNLRTPELKNSFVSTAAYAGQVTCMRAVTLVRQAISEMSLLRLKATLAMSLAGITFIHVSASGTRGSAAPEAASAIPSQGRKTRRKVLSAGWRARRGCTPHRRPRAGAHRRYQSTRLERRLVYCRVRHVVGRHGTDSRPAGARREWGARAGGADPGTASAMSSTPLYQSQTETRGLNKSPSG
jgi:hypothetical protein